MTGGRHAGGVPEALWRDAPQLPDVVVQARCRSSLPSTSSWHDGHIAKAAIASQYWNEMCAMRCRCGQPLQGAASSATAWSKTWLRSASSTPGEHSARLRLVVISCCTWHLSIKLHPSDTAGPCLHFVSTPILVSANLFIMLDSRVSMCRELQVDTVAWHGFQGPGGQARPLARLTQNLLGRSIQTDDCHSARCAGWFCCSERVLSSLSCMHLLLQSIILQYSSCK